MPKLGVIKVEGIPQWRHHDVIKVNGDPLAPCQTELGSPF
jgi:hypothetical protein